MRVRASTVNTIKFKYKYALESGAFRECTKKEVREMARRLSFRELLQWKITARMSNGEQSYSTADEIYYEDEKVKIAVNYRRRLGCHPAVTDYPPEIRFSRKRGKLFVLVSLDKDSYSSSKHNHSIDSSIEDFRIYESDGKVQVYLLIGYELSRWSYGFRYNGVFSASYLLGTEGGGFVLRVPAYSIDEALQMLEPAEVRRARGKGLKVLRQGDLFLVETKKKKITDYQLPDSHKLVLLANNTAIIRHPQHSPIKLPHLNFKPVVANKFRPIVAD